MSGDDTCEAIDERARIDVNENREIALWAQRLGVKRAQLIAAVAATGPRARDVARYLRNRREPRAKDPRHEQSRRLAFHSTN